jgi:methyl-accepting chemotaxis protein
VPFTEDFAFSSTEIAAFIQEQTAIAGQAKEMATQQLTGIVQKLVTEIAKFEI